MNYENYEMTQGWEAEAFGQFTPAQDIYYQAELQRYGVTSRLHLHVLDIGFGNGSFLGWCRSRGWQCDGLEVNDRLIARANAHGYTAEQHMDVLSSKVQQPYDLITAFDVLEHIDRESIVAFLTSVGRVCSTHTLFILRFPNGDNPFSMPIQNGDVTHKTPIGHGMLHQVAKLAGFDVITLGGPSQPLQGAGLVRRLSVIIGKPVRWAVGMAIRQLFMGGAKVNFSSNLLAVLKKHSIASTATWLD
ncbi:MAG: methyltransferase domain-containing protein [Ferruginibacter sp.]|nr:methyltransferase domain-containing protein [Ferruginibacter sp.]